MTRAEFVSSSDLDEMIAWCEEEADLFEGSEMGVMPKRMAEVLRWIQEWWREPPCWDGIEGDRQ